MTNYKLIKTTHEKLLIILTSSMLRFLIVRPTESIVFNKPQKVPIRPKKISKDIIYFNSSLGSVFSL